MHIDIHVKYLLFLSYFNANSIFLDRLLKSTQISNFKKIRPLGAELFHTDGQTDRKHDEANSRFSQFCELT